MDNNNFKSLQVLFLALLGGQLTMCIAFCIITGLRAGFSTEGIFWALGAIISISTIIIGVLLYNQRITKGVMLTGLSDKLAHYRGTVITRLALVEGGNIVLMVFMFLDNGSTIYLIFFAFGVGVFIYFRPTAEAFIQDYKLKAKEEEELRYMIS
ncbi:MAG: hypothetical protein AAGG75_02355 [Bacteroidota bacterium]